MIFYFSGTGNTRFVAEQIAAGIGEKLVFIPDAIRDGRYEFELADGETVGFCFPTHGWQPPRIVREFIRKLRILPLSRGRQRGSEQANDQTTPSPSRSAMPLGSSKNSGGEYCWAVTTCGDNMGETMTILNKKLAANDGLTCGGKPLQASAMFSVIMPESYVCLPFMYTDTPEKERAKIAAAQKLLPHIIECIRERREGIEELEKGATPRLYSYVIGEYFNKRMVNDKKFTVDTDVCIKCGKCQKVCPVDNITGTPPEWIHNGRCTSCLACYHYCPVHAINFGKITRKRGQYFFKGTD